MTPGHAHRHHRHHRRRRRGTVAAAPSAPACPDGFLYAVGPGDGLGELTARFDLSRAALAAANPQVVDWARLSPGQLLCIPAGEPFEVCLPLRPSEPAAAAAGVLLARSRRGAGVQLLLAATGLPPGRCVARFERAGEVYLSLPLDGGLAAASEPGGVLAHFDRVSVAAGGVTLLEGRGRDCLPAPPGSPLGPF